MVSAYGPEMPPPPAPPRPRPAGAGGSADTIFQVPEKFALPCAGVTTGHATTSASSSNRPDLVILPSALCPLPFALSLRCRRRGLRHQRLRPVDVRWIGAGAGLELLRAAAEHFSGVEIAVGVGRVFVDGAEEPGRRAVRAPRVQQMALQIVLEELVERAREHPEEPVVADADVVRLLDVRKLVEVLAVLVEHLDAIVRAIGDVDASVLVDRDRVRRLQLAVAGAARAPHHQELAVLVELGDARVAVAVADEEGPVGQPRDVGGALEVRAVVARLVARAQRHQQLLAVVAELPDLMMDVVDDPDVVLWIVRAHRNRVRAAALDEQIVPLRPRLDGLAAAVHHDETVAKLRRRRRRLLA